MFKNRNVIVIVFAVVYLYLILSMDLTFSQQPTLAWEKFKDKYGGENLSIIWNKHTGLPKSISGMKVVLPQGLEQPKDTTDILKIIYDFLDENKDIFQIPLDQLKTKNIWKFQKKWYATLKTHFKGIPIYHGQIGFTLDEQGQILSYASDYNPKMDINIKPSISKEEAIKLALDNHKPKLEIPVSPSQSYLIIYQDKSLIDSTAYNLVWYILLATEADHPEVDRVFLIDAHNGEILQNFYPHPNAITGTIQGETYPEHSTDAVVIVPFEHEEISASTDNDNTNAVGNYSLNPGAGGHTLELKLEGPFVKVQSYNTSTNTDQDVQHTATITDPGTYNFTWTSTNCAPDDGDGLNVFWHANRLHDDYYQAVLGINWTHNWTGTSQMRYSVNRGNANDAYAGNPIKIYSDAAARNCDIAYHETTHNILYNMFGGSYIGWPNANSEAYAFDEGFSDYVACSFNNDHIIGENVITPRDCENNMQYPGTSYSMNGHIGGQLISGIAWDLWNKEGLAHNATDVLLFAGLSQMATLASPYYFSNPSQSNYFESLLTADDNNSNLSDGTPHDREIFQAFRNHDLLPHDVYCRDSNTDDGNIPSAVPFWTSPDIMVDAPPYYSGSGDPPHENPELGNLNKVHIRVRNLGYLDVTQCTVKFYWANPSTGLTWPGSWNYIDQATINNLQPVDTDPDGKKVIIDWTPTGTGTGHRCVLVRIECNEDIITEEGNIKYDNNIAQKNVTIVDLQSSFSTDFFLLPLPKEVIAERNLKITFLNAPYNVKTILRIPGRVKIEGEKDPDHIQKKKTRGCLGILPGKTIWEVKSSPEDKEVIVPNFSCINTERVELIIDAPDDLPKGIEFTLRIIEEWNNEIIGGLDYLVRK